MDKVQLARTEHEPHQQFHSEEKVAQQVRVQQWCHCGQRLLVDEIRVAHNVRHVSGNIDQHDTPKVRNDKRWFGFDAENHRGH